jgi:hypothetical protein
MISNLWVSLASQDWSAPFQGALVALLLVTFPMPALAKTQFDRTADLEYRSADKLGIGANLSVHKDERFYFAPAMRVGLAIGGASLSAGYSLLEDVPKAQFAIDLHVTAVRTFDDSGWPSGMWVGPEMSITFLYVKLGVGRFQPRGMDHPWRTQFGGGIVVPF